MNGSDMPRSRLSAAHGDALRVGDSPARGDGLGAALRGIVESLPSAGSGEVAD